MFSKKNKLIIVIMVVFIKSTVILYADCDMVAMISKTGFSISTIEMGTGDYDDPDEFIDFLIDHSTGGTNPDGYGVTYIDEDGNFPYINTTNLVTEFYSPQAWYVTAQDILANTYYYDYVHNGNHYFTGPMEAARDAIKLDDNNVAIVLGHDRRSSTALGNHPFRFDYDANTTFQFMHNGGIDDDIKLALYNELGGASWFTTNNHPSNWNTSYTQYNQFIDSEILFHWIMSNIIDNGGDVLSGIHDALTATIDDGEIDLEYEFSNPYYYYYWHNVVNFVLTDGETLYLFRNGGNNWDHHLLSWQENDNDSYSVKTQTELENGLNQFDCVVISRDEEPIVYNNFFDLDIKVFASGYNWISYPRLTEQGTSNGYLFEQAYFANNEPGMFQLTSGGNPTITDFEKILGHRLGDIYDMNIYYDDLTGFNDQDFDNMLHRHEGYKVKVASGAESTTLVIDGDRLPSNYELSEETLEASKYHWLGYWLPYSQDIDVAFGEFWDKVKIVKAENWTYADLSNPRGAGDPEPKPSMKIRPLEYGKGYLVKFSEDVDDFHWNDTNIVSEPERKEVAENFTYEEKADYEVIDVLGIDPSITEIGVFEDGICVGAVAVQDSAVQILVYSDNANRDPIPFTFEVTTGRGSSIPIKSYNSLNLRTGEYENRLIISGRQEYSVVKFGEQPEPEITINTAKLSGNYPNPFNPTTTISFSLPNEQNIELTIYNIKGQKVKKLYSGTADKGDHSIVWEGKDMTEKPVSSGLYFYKLRTNSNVLTRKMIMMK
ncbi:MAG: hypothetical protein DRJ01_10165 [Bacteroidetes bacterium]|nr:MAG: hypothetical protein DRJ01_10165 [Bacteroidota bacterium]